MNRTNNAHPRAIALLMAAVALPAIPAFAQEVAPPPVAATVPAPPPVAAPAPAPAAQAPTFAPRQEVVQPLPVRPTPPVAAEDAAPAPRAQAAPAPRRAPRPAVERTPVVAAPVAAAPVAEPVPAPVVTEVAPVPAPVADPAPDVMATETSTTSTTSIPWLWIGLGVLALAALAALFGRGRKNRVDEVYDDEPVAIAPIAAAPVVAAPIVAAPIAQPVIAPKSVAPTALVADDERPWIGLSIWPKQVDADGNVQYDLVVENAGDVEAHDVRVSSFLIDGTNSSPMESSLMGGSETRSVDVRAGASVQIAQMMTATDGVSPRIVAEARYPLPGGGEGHIAARFAIDTAKDGTVEARLDDLLERV